MKPNRKHILSAIGKYRFGVMEFDDVKVSGVILSEPGGVPVRDLRGTIATAYRIDSGLTRFKVWPDNERDPQLPPDHDGKLWFDWSDPRTTVKVTRAASASTRWARRKLRKIHRRLK